MTTTYHLKITRPRPSMWQDKEVFQADSYQAAVAHAQARFLETRRTISLCTGENGMYTYHYIAENGLASDRCTNSGVPEVANLLPEGAL